MAKGTPGNPGGTGASGRWRSRFTRTLAAGVKDRAQLLEMLAESQQRGVLDAEAFAMLEGALAVADLQVRDIMIPRTQMVCLRREDPISRILPAVVESRHSRFPVLDGDRDDVAGILLAKDLLRLFAGGMPATFDMREYLRPAVFVPEAKRLNVLLREFRDSRNHMAIVVDEYGGVAGLVTIEDVIEQIVGDIGDEFDVEDDQNIRREGERQFSVRGSTRIDEFNQYFHAELPEGQFDTVAGLVMKQLGRMPRRGETVMLGMFEFRVMRTDRRRIDSLRVTIPPHIHSAAPAE
ncbi:MAG TPA: transporter associated domain-containing protein [Steroidobacteraceae bacterium]|nr:transporter associated domain-containing protein [Steroidobacteraceae bacterium]